jgi:uncharacterized protein YjiS (DUF1127 family)
LPKGRWSGVTNKEQTMTTTTYNRETNNRLVPDFLTRVSSRVVNYVSRSRAERQLQALDDRLLADIGMRRSEIQRMVWGN